MATKKSTRRDPLRVVAIHEAGHAVAAFWLNVRIKHVTIVPAEDSLGHVHRRAVQFGRDGLFDDSPRGVDRAERHIMVCFAGQIAQRKHAPRSKWRVDGHADQEVAGALFTHIDHPDKKVRNLQISLLWRRTECLVDTHWKGIQAVADALLKHKTLDAQGVRAAIDRTHGFKPLVLGRGGERREVG
jgi:hypothetical protein